MHKVQMVELTFSDGSKGRMQFVLDPRIGPTEETARTVQREASDENIQAEIDRSVFWDGLTVTSWRRYG